MNFSRPFKPEKALASTLSKATQQCFRALVILALLYNVSPVRADGINLSGAEVAPNIAEIHVLDDRVKLVLELYVKDLMAFEELVPDEWLNGSGIKRPPIEQRMRHFAEQTFQVLAAGKKLAARLDVLEPRLRIDRQLPSAGMLDPASGQRLPSAPEDKRALYAEISYPFTGKPADLVFVPPMDQEKRTVATIGFIAYHKTVPVIDFRYLGAPVRLKLDWADPWYSRFEQPNLTRHHKDPLMSFLYVEPYEVRHEMLVRVKDMANWIDLGLRGKEYIEVDELEPLKQRVGEFLLTRNRLLVDGKALPPVLDRTNYVKVSLSGVQIMQTPERQEISSAIVGVILAYTTTGMPQNVSVDWDLFTDKIQRVAATAIDPAGPLLNFVEPRSNVHTWTNFLKTYRMPTIAPTGVAGTLPDLSLPLGSAVCVLALLPLGRTLMRRRRAKEPLGAGLTACMVLLVAGLTLYPTVRVSVARPALLPVALEDEQAKSILESLLTNIYRSFDFRKESDVYDRLATSVSGDLLPHVYLQSRRSLIIEQAGGAQARIKDVQVADASTEGPLDGRLAYRVRAHWTASGSVGHWGHTHVRENIYHADFRIEAIDGVWKLTGLDLLDQERIGAGAQAGVDPR